MFTPRAWFDRSSKAGDEASLREKSKGGPVEKKVVVKKKSSDVILGVTLRRPLNGKPDALEELVIAELYEEGLLATSTPLAIGDLLRSIDSKPIGGPDLENEVNVATYLKKKVGKIEFGVVLGAKAEIVPLETRSTVDRIMELARGISSVMGLGDGENTPKTHTPSTDKQAISAEL